MASNSEQDLSKKTVVDLKSILRQGGQPVGGTKSILIQRIIETQADLSATFRANVLEFIVGQFPEEDDFNRARDLAGAKWGLNRDYKGFVDDQAATLLRYSLLRLVRIKETATRSRAERSVEMDKGYMNPGWSVTGFVLIDGNVVFGHLPKQPLTPRHYAGMRSHLEQLAADGTCARARYILLIVNRFADIRNIIKNPTLRTTEPAPRDPVDTSAHLIATDAERSDVAPLLLLLQRLDNIETLARANTPDRKQQLTEVRALLEELPESFPFLSSHE